MRTPKNSSRRPAILALFAGLTLAASGAPAVPDLTGQWKINVDKSDFGMLFAPASATVKIEQQDTRVTVTDEETNAQGEVKHAVSSFATDGTESTGALLATPYTATGTMTWKDGSLTFNGKGSSSSVDFEVKEAWTLSPDKKTVTITRHFSSVRGNTDQTVVLEH